MPAVPRRIVALDPEAVDNALALDAPIVGVPDPGWVATPRYVADWSGGFASIGFPTEPDIERILALEPDLIIGIGLDGLSAEAIATLGEVAPAVVLGRVSGSQARWRGTFRAFADVLALSSEADGRLERYEQRVAEIADRLAGAGRPPADTTVSVARMYADGRAEYRVRGSFPVSVTDDLGFARPPGHQVERPEEPFVQISPEQVDRLDADLLFLAVDPGAGRTVASYTQHNRLWPRCGGGRCTPTSLSSAACSRPAG